MFRKFIRLLLGKPLVFIGWLAQVRAGFNYEQQLDNWFTYTLRFRKP